MDLISVEPIAAYRVDDKVLIFLDDPKGWTFFRRLGEMEKSRRDVLAEAFVVEAGKQGMDAFMRPDGTPGSILVVEVSKTTLPSDFPDRALVAIGNGHSAESLEGVPAFVPANW